MSSSEPLSSSAIMPTSTAATAAVASPLESNITIRPCRRPCSHQEILNGSHNDDTDSSFGWGDFPLILAASSSESSAEGGASISKPSNNAPLSTTSNITTTTTSLPPSSLSKSSSSSFDMLVVHLNDHDSSHAMVFRHRHRGPLSCSSRKMTNVSSLKDNHHNDDDDISETESRTSASSSSSYKSTDDDDFDHGESDVQVVAVVNKIQVKQEDETMQECQQQRRQRRHVHFSTVSVREHAVTLGSHPFCTGAYPLTLDWPHTTPDTSSTSSSSSSESESSSHGEYTIDEYEKQQEQKRAGRCNSRQCLLRVDTGNSHQTAPPPTFCQSTGEPIIATIVHMLSPQEEQAARLQRQTQLPFRLSALERRARLATVRGTSFAALQEEEYQRRREEQMAAADAQNLGTGSGGSGGGGGGLVRTSSMNSLVYSSSSALMRRRQQQQQFWLHAAAAASADSTQINKFVGSGVTTTTSRAKVITRPRDVLFL